MLVHTRKFPIFPSFYSILTGIKIRFLLLFFLYQSTSFSQDSVQIASREPIHLDRSEKLTLHSRILGSDYYVYVCLPRHYNKIGPGFPVLYMTDADDFTMMTAEVSRLLAVNADIPEVIVAGIAYGSHIMEKGNKRFRDYSFAADPNYPEGGGAALFLEFFRKEVIHLVDSVYNTNQTERAFYGTSLGALFGTYVMFHHQETFNRYILGSPSLWWNNQAIFKDITEFSDQKKSLHVKAYFSVGSMENDVLMIQPLLKLKNIFEQKNIQDINYKIQILEGENHLSAAPTALIKGLTFIYGR